MGSPLHCLVSPRSVAVCQRPLPFMQFANITSWRWQSNRYVSIKFHNRDVAQRERKIMHQILTADPTHRGFQVVRKTIDTFDLTAEHGTHSCSVYKPLWETFKIYQGRLVDGRLPLPLVKAYAYILLIGLDYLHTKCNIIHTGMVTST